MNNDRLEIAKLLIDLGLRLVLVRPRSKRPLQSDWQLQATKDKSTVECWLEAIPEANLGVLVGKAGGVIVVDVDKQADVHHLLPFPETLKVFTPNGGRHFYFRIPEGKSCGSMKKVFGNEFIEVYGNGYVVAPGSIGISGHCYSLVRDWDDGTPKDLVLPDAPDWLLGAWQW